MQSANSVSDVWVTCECSVCNVSIVWTTCVVCVVRAIAIIVCVRVKIMWVSCETRASEVGRVSVVRMTWAMLVSCECRVSDMLPNSTPMQSHYNKFYWFQKGMLQAIQKHRVVLILIRKVFVRLMGTTIVDRFVSAPPRML